MDMGTPKNVTFHIPLSSHDLTAEGVVTSCDSDNSHLRAVKA